MSTNISNDSSRHYDWNLCGHFDVSYSVKISKLVFLTIILLSSLVGNALIVTMVYTRQELRKTINFFIVNMAISDLFLTLFVPIYMASIAASSFPWPFIGKVGLILCKLSVFLPFVSLTVSVQCLVWIALDRFVAVVFPMNNYFISSRFRKFAIASTWMVAMIINSTDFYTMTFVKNGGALLCHSDKNTFLLHRNVMYARIALICIAPMLIMTIVYCAIAVTLRRQDKTLRCAAVHESHQRKRQAIKMSICIISTFYVFILPYTIIMLIFLTGKIAVSCSVYDLLIFAALSGLNISSTTNPIICFTFIGSYRRGIRELFSSCWLHMKKARSTLKRGEAEEINLQSLKPEFNSKDRVNLTFYYVNSCN